MVVVRGDGGDDALAGEDWGACDDDGGFPREWASSSLHSAPQIQTFFDFSHHRGETRSIERYAPLAFVWKILSF